MKSIILVTGTDTGIGNLSALALAEAGHIVYTTMRDVAGRNRRASGGRANRGNHAEIDGQGVRHQCIRRTGSEPGSITSYAARRVWTSGVDEQYYN